MPHYMSREELVFFAAGIALATTVILFALMLIGSLVRGRHAR